ncbi:MAG: nitroreductase family protein [Bacteroidales bacterium]|jgi:predicted oxidoreductase (fatty acid repression mutant protein)|nr:nitroreductase family protein [Bacteroidales bacterium]
MKNTLQDSIIKRRTYYSITNSSPVSDKEIEALLRLAITNVPSAFNSQTTRLVLLLGEQHLKLWQIVSDTLQAIVPAENFPATQKKLSSFAAGYGTVLFLEDNDIVESLQKTFPTYAASFPAYSEHTSAMHQFALWTLLEEAGFGCSLQHYNPLIDQKVKSQWALPQSWKLIAQMPFGTPTAEPTEKTFEPLEKRMLVFK